MPCLFQTKIIVAMFYEGEVEWPRGGRLIAFFVHRLEWALTRPLGDLKPRFWNPLLGHLHTGRSWPFLQVHFLARLLDDKKNNHSLRRRHTLHVLFSQLFKSSSKPVWPAMWDPWIQILARGQNSKCPDLEYIFRACLIEMANADESMT